MSIDNTYKKYSSYTVEELLNDDYFIQSMLNPTKESELFWGKVIENDIIDIHEYKLARYFINSVGVSSESISHEEMSDLWENIRVQNKLNIKKRRRRILIYFSASAGIAALFALLFSLFNIHDQAQEETFTHNIEDIKAPDMSKGDIQLILADNETVSLKGQEADIIYNEDGIEINNQETGLKNEQANTDQSNVYNQLIVPLGKRSMLTFSEGSKMWVNAGTRVVYPIVFKKEQREIYVDGEIFLEVSRNDECPFIVKTKNLDVKVLGTSFNIMAYEKDTVQSIVLVSGVVKVSSKDKKETLLSPNEMFTYQNNSHQVQIVDVENYILWKSRIYQYKSENLEVILKRLGRYYGQEINCSPRISYMKCSGKLDLKDDLRLVLDGISKTAPIVYEYIDGKYLITNK